LKCPYCIVKEHAIDLQNRSIADIIKSFDDEVSIQIVCVTFGTALFLE